MIIAKTPLRVSLFGGGTDYKEFYSEYGSSVIGFCTDKYSYVSLRKTPSIFPFKSSISYSKTERVSNNKDILHDGVRGVLEYLNIKQGLEINYTGDLPAQTGTGSSSSFIVGLLNAIYCLKNKKVSKKELAQQAIEVERILLAEPGGIQDQIWAAYGGINSIEIDKTGSFEVKPLPISEEFTKDLIGRSILIYTGKTRKSFKIANQISSLDNIEAKKKILKLSRQAYNFFLDSDLDSIAECLDRSWNEKKKLSPLVCPKTISDLYRDLTEMGMQGGKLLGAGGSGFIFGIFKTKEHKETVKKRYKRKNINFAIDKEGSKIINR
jgi:D-glycero-alpha-D-manno-heptose-7-phosphate kinase